MKCIDFTERYTELQKNNLNTLHTKQLLHKKNIAYVRSELCRDCFTANCQECNECIANQNLNKEDIKAILATREHVLNKKEAKAFRKKRIKEGR